MPELSDLTTTSTKRLVSLQKRLNKLYHEGKSPASDEDYDRIVDELKRRGVQVAIGAPVIKKRTKVKLPYHMGSATKITPDEPAALDRWMSRHPGPVVISDKLDGVSCLAVIREHQVKLYTRGDGEYGSDISYLQSTLDLPTDVDLVVRGELIVSRRDFPKYARGSGGEKRSEGPDSQKLYQNARNMVAGLVNGRQSVPELQFVVYECVSCEDATISDQYVMLKELGFKVVHHKSVASPSLATFEKILTERKAKSEFEIDGIIVHSSAEYERNTSGNPDYFFAFKMLFEDAIRETKVLGLEWNVSKTGLLKPVVLLEPVDVSGVTIRRASGFNAEYVKSRGIDKGAIVRVTRSKEVIPYILDVVKPANKVELPSDQWQGKDLLATGDASIRDQELKELAYMLSELGVKNVTRKLCADLLDHDFYFLPTLMQATEAEFAEFLTEKRAASLHRELHQGVAKSSPAKVIAAAGLWGPGKGKATVEKMIREDPSLLEQPGTREFVRDMTPYWKQAEKLKSKKLDGQVVVFTGYRDAEAEQVIEQNGGRVGGSVTRDTTIVVAKSGVTTTKTERAAKLGIPVVTWEQFVKIRL